MSAWSTTLPTVIGWYWMRRLVEGVEVEREVVYVGGVGLPMRTVIRTGIAGSTYIGDYAGREFQPVAEAKP